VHVLACEDLRVNTICVVCKYTSKSFILLHNNADVVRDRT